VYGDADERISSERADGFSVKAKGNVELLRIEGMEHQFDPFHHASMIRDAMADFVDNY